MKLNPLFLLLFCSHIVSAEILKREANNGNLLMEDVPEISKQVVEDLRQYQNVRSAPFRGFDASGSSIFISTRFGDVSQIHQVEMAGGARRQLSFFDEPVGSVSRQPGSNNLAFTMDAGGSEYAQIFVLDSQTGQSKMLTDGQSRNGSVVWSNDGTRIAFKSTQRNGASNDLWVMNPEHPESSKMILESPGGSWWGPSDWSSDDKQVLIQEYVSVEDSRIYIVDAEGKERIRIAGSANKKTVNYGLNFDSENEGIFYVTNEFSEYEQLAYRKIKGGKTKVITSDIQWNVEEFAMSKDGRRAAFSVNENGIDKLYLLNTKNFKFKEVGSIPIGLIGSLEFDDSGKKLGMTLNTPRFPSDSFVLNLGRRALDFGNLTRWTTSEVGGLNTAEFSEPELVHFESFDQRKIPAFVYRPNNIAKSIDGRRPVIINIHGGPEGQFRPSFASTAQLWMDKLGAIVIAPNVRGSAGYGKEYISLDNGMKREDSVKDIGALLDWIATQKDMDAKRVAVIGGSYGGYMVLASAVHYSDRLKAAIDIVGISNFVTFLENTKSYRRDLRRAEYGDERIPAMRAYLEKISPNNNIEKIQIPMFVVQGQNDPRVPVTEAEQVVKSLRDANKTVWYMNALNEGHGYRKKENRDIYRQAVIMFFKEYLIQ